MYGQNGFGQGCLLARRLVEHHVRLLEVSMEAGTLTMIICLCRVRCQILDSALAGLISDLERRGFIGFYTRSSWNRFGRTPEINENTGRDHFPRAFTSLMAGGGVKGGFVYGETDRKAHTVKEGHMLLVCSMQRLAMLLVFQQNEWSPHLRVDHLQLETKRNQLRKFWQFTTKIIGINRLYLKLMVRMRCIFCILCSFGSA